MQLTLDFWKNLCLAIHIVFFISMDDTIQNQNTQPDTQQPQQESPNVNPNQQQEAQVFVTDNNKKLNSFFSWFKPHKTVAVLSLLLIAIATPFALHFLSRPTNLPTKASTGTTLSLSGSSKYIAGQPISMDLLLDPAEKPVSAAKVVLTYDKSIIQPATNPIVSTNAFPTIVDGPTIQ